MTSHPRSPSASPQSPPPLWGRGPSSHLTQPPHAACVDVHASPALCHAVCCVLQATSRSWCGSRLSAWGARRRSASTASCSSSASTIQVRLGAVGAHRSGCGRAVCAQCICVGAVRVLGRGVIRWGSGGGLRAEPSRCPPQLPLLASLLCSGWMLQGRCCCSRLATSPTCPNPPFPPASPRLHCHVLLLPPRSWQRGRAVRRQRAAGTLGTPRLPVATERCTTWRPLSQTATGSRSCSTGGRGPGRPVYVYGKLGLNGKQVPWLAALWLGADTASMQREAACSSAGWAAVWCRTCRRWPPWLTLAQLSIHCLALSRLPGFSWARGWLRGRE